MASRASPAASASAAAASRDVHHSPFDDPHHRQPVDTHRHAADDDDGAEEEQEEEEEDDGSRLTSEEAELQREPMQDDSLAYDNSFSLESGEDDEREDECHDQHDPTAAAKPKPSSSSSSSSSSRSYFPSFTRAVSTLTSSSSSSSPSSSSSSSQPSLLRGLSMRALSSRVSKTLSVASEWTKQRVLHTHEPTQDPAEFTARVQQLHHTAGQCKQLDAALTAVIAAQHEAILASQAVAQSYALITAQLHVGSASAAIKPAAPLPTALPAKPAAAAQRSAAASITAAKPHAQKHTEEGDEPGSSQQSSEQKGEVEEEEEDFDDEQQHQLVLDSDEEEKQQQHQQSAASQATQPHLPDDHSTPSSSLTDSQSTTSSSPDAPALSSSSSTHASDSTTSAAASSSAAIAATSSATRDLLLLQQHQSYSTRLLGERLRLTDALSTFLDQLHTLQHSIKVCNAELSTLDIDRLFFDNCKHALQAAQVAEMAHSDSRTSEQQNKHRLAVAVAKSKCAQAHSKYERQQAIITEMVQAISEKKHTLLTQGLHEVLAMEVQVNQRAVALLERQQAAQPLATTNSKKTKKKNQKQPHLPSEHEHGMTEKRKKAIETGNVHLPPAIITDEKAPLR